jgi:hypothetical protein
MSLSRAETLSPLAKSLNKIMCINGFDGLDGFAIDESMTK